MRLFDSRASGAAVDGASQRRHKPVSSATPLFVDANAAASGASAPLLDAVSCKLHQADRQFKILTADNPRELLACAFRAGWLAHRYRGMLVAAGGDGTINAVVQEAHRNGRPFGVLPLGRINYFARSHGLPTDLDEAIAIWLVGHTELIQIGQANGHAFLVNARVGLPSTRRQVTAPVVTDSATA